MGNLTEQDIAELLAALDVVVRAQGLSAANTVARLQEKLIMMISPPSVLVDELATTDVSK
jgi:hypothetical protein